MADGEIPRGIRRVPLSAIAEATGGALRGDDTDITDVVHDSRAVPAGALFVAVTGTNDDGHRHVAEATRHGASAVMVERVVDGLQVPQLVVDDARRSMAVAAAVCWGRPSERLAVVGVTGTNGKTTVVTLVGEMLSSLGVRSLVIGTLTGARTTPESTDLQARLSAAADDGVEVVAMEVSSHALALHRADEVRFAVAVFTNLGLDHLDFHGSVERYFEAKATLFEPGRARIAVLNVDSPHGRLLRDTSSGDRPTVEYGIDGAVDLTIGPRGSTFTWRGHEVRTPLLGRFNVLNALAAAEVCLALGHDPAGVSVALGGVSAPSGRFELVEAGQPFLVVVDYAHTPDGLEQVLETARDLTDGALRVVFGCGGDRDRSKRPRMGEVACRLADVVIVTSDNPRSEDPSAIIAAVTSGCANGAATAEVDRRIAIGLAIGAASPGDVVVIAGKGHERSQVVGDRVLPFDDRDVARDVLESGLGRTMIRIFVAAGVALVVATVGTKILINWLGRLEIGQPIHEDVPEGHITKAGTPTMGGAAIVAAVVISYVVSAYYRGIYTVRGLLVVLAIAGAGLVGLADDLIKVRNERNLGLGKRAKILSLGAVAALFAVLLVTQTQQKTTLSFTRWDSVGLQLGKVGWVIWAIVLILGSANAVNLTDGLDGLAAGSSIFAFSAFVVIGFWSFRNPGIYQLTQGLDLAVIAAAMVGACAGFLWWNAAPARIFMGDTGSLAIGTGLVCLALTTNTDLLLPIIGALFVAETISVIVQVISFRSTGKRVFRMAPIHHHFELAGWPEITVIIRFWMLSAACTAAGIGLYYYSYLRVTGTLAR